MGVNCELVSVVYKRKGDPIEYRCFNHYEQVQKTSFANVKQRGCALCNRQKKAENMTGEKHYRWNGGYHSETGRARRSAENSEWRKSVFHRDNYTCACCGVRGQRLEAHHIKNFSSNPELRFDITNGITMCKNCHGMHVEGSFHSIYGVHNNSKQQLEEYFETKNTYFKGVFSYEENIKGVLDKWR